LFVFVSCCAYFKPTLQNRGQLESFFLLLINICQILHILTASLGHAQAVLRAGLVAGFRESGAINLTSPSSATPMVAIRSMGLGLESIVGCLDSNDEATCFVPENSLRGLLTISNERFEENSRRKERFWKALLEDLRAESSGDGLKKKRGEDGGDWEDKDVRRERLRREGLEKSKAKKATTNTEPS
jgi:tRNA wybutosine-synthesizing protein 3